MEKVLPRTEAMPRLNRRSKAHKRDLSISKRMKQKLMGSILLLICAVVLWLCSTGTTPEDQDVTAVVLLAPLGLWMLFTKEIVIY